MPPRTGTGLSTTVIRPSVKGGMSGLGLLKCRLGAQTSRSRDSSTCRMEEEMDGIAKIRQSDPDSAETIKMSNYPCFLQFPISRCLPYTLIRKCFVIHY